MSAYVMNSATYAAKALDVAENYKTAYIWGGLGEPITEASLARCVAQYGKNETAGYAAKARPLIGTGFGFDCVGLVKALLWGWNGNRDAYLGGAAYQSHGVPDSNEGVIINMCDGVSRDFSNIEAGEVVWISGHIGIYVGAYVVVECTPRWNNGVQKTTLGNATPFLVTGTVGTRTWTKHGKLPWIDYREEDMDVSKLSNEDCYAILQKAQKYAETLPLPSSWDAEAALRQAVSDGVTDGSRPMCFSTRLEAAVQADRALAKAKNLIVEDDRR